MWHPHICDIPTNVTSPQMWHPHKCDIPTNFAITFLVCSHTGYIQLHHMTFCMTDFKHIEQFLWHNKVYILINLLFRHPKTLPKAFFLLQSRLQPNNFFLDDPDCPVIAPFVQFLSPFWFNGFVKLIAFCPWYVIQWLHTWINKIITQ